METFLGLSGRQMRIPIVESSGIAEARRAGTTLSASVSFSETDAGRLSLVITEAATNILKHGGEGEVLLRRIQSGPVGGIEVLALNGGPGMPDVARSMTDGISTAGSYGVGLGAMQRMSDQFDIYTSPGNGVAVWMRIWQKPERPAEPWQVGAVCLPMDGETLCGDAWGIGCDADKATLQVVDGLGHGPQAAVAAEAAVQRLERTPDLPPDVLLDDAHAALRGTRGAAMAVARIAPAEQRVVFAGIGNIAACVIEDGKRRQLASLNGIVGNNVRKIQPFDAAWGGRSLLVMCSDGLGTRWDLERYPGLASRHPGLIAAVLYRDHSRRRDDVCVVVLKAAAVMPAASVQSAAPATPASPASSATPTQARS